jgi:hypothetical protein
LKHPTDFGIAGLGSQSTISEKMQKAFVARKTRAAA